VMVLAASPLGDGTGCVSFRWWYWLRLL